MKGAARQPRGVPGSPCHPADGMVRGVLAMAHWCCYTPGPYFSWHPQAGADRFTLPRIRSPMSYDQIPAGKDIPNDIYVAIEIPPNHAPIKYDIDKDTSTLFVDRFMATPMFYPANYGFIPNTLADDGDPLDVLVVTPHPVAPGSVIRCRPVGVLHMTDDGGGDAKLVAVPHDKLT